MSNKIISVMGDRGVTVRVDTTDVAQGLSSAMLVKDRRNLMELTVQCEPSQGNAARICWGDTSPSQGENAIGLYLSPGDVVRITGEVSCATVKHISAVNDNASALQLIPGY